MSEDGSLMELKDMKVKRIILEIRYPPHFAVNRNIWDIAEKFKENSTGIGITVSNGIAIQKPEVCTELTAEIQRASYDAENVSDVAKAIRDASDFLQHIIDLHGISLIDRLGSRFYYMLSEKKEFNREYYAELISKTTKLVENGGFPPVSTGGLVVRFPESERRIRFGVFSGDKEVITRYHRFHTSLEFLQPCILFDIDLCKDQVATGFIKRKGFRPKKFSMKEEIQAAYKQSLSFVSRYLRLLEEKGNA